MKFLIDEDLPTSCVALCQRHGFTAVDVRNVHLRGSSDTTIAEYAKRELFTLITGDFDFSDIRNYPPKDYHGIIVLSARKNATAKDFLRLLEHFFVRKDILNTAEGKLIIVESDRIRIRQ